MTTDLLTAECLPFAVIQNRKEELKEQTITMLMIDLKRAEEQAERKGWIDANDLEKELGLLE